jgi:serine protease
MLFQNEPNPVQQSTSISFKLPVPAHTRLSILDLGGRLLDTVVDEELSAGVWSFDWIRGTLAPGVYLYRLSLGEESITKEMVLR